jgi:hypothetical protein
MDLLIKGKGPSQVKRDLNIRNIKIIYVLQTLLHTKPKIFNQK